MSYTYSLRKGDTVDWSSINSDVICILLFVHNCPSLYVYENGDYYQQHGGQHSRFVRITKEEYESQTSYDEDPHASYDICVRPLTKEVIMNWVEAAQAIEDGEKIQFRIPSTGIFAESIWQYVVKDAGVMPHLEYRKEPRTFKDGWYHYEDQILYNTLNRWFVIDISEAVDWVEEAKVGDFIKP